MTAETALKHFVVMLESPGPIILVCVIYHEYSSQLPTIRTPTMNQPTQPTRTIRSLRQAQARLGTPDSCLDASISMMTISCCFHPSTTATTAFPSNVHPPYDHRVELIQTPSLHQPPSRSNGTIQRLSMTSYGILETLHERTRAYVPGR
jgi:hypothetical protein